MRGVVPSVAKVEVVVLQGKILSVTHLSRLPRPGGSRLIEIITTSHEKRRGEERRGEERRGEERRGEERRGEEIGI